MNEALSKPIRGDLHRHGATVHRHPHGAPHRHEHDHSHAHDHGHTHERGGHTHGLVPESIKRSREGIRAVVLSLGILGTAAAIQAFIFFSTNSVALLADLIHNVGDALTAVPIAVAFMLHSRRAEGYAGLAVVAAIFISACVAGFEAVGRLIDPNEPTHLGALAIAGLVGFAANWLAAIVRTRAGRRLDSAASIADGAHARADAYVSLAVVGSAAAVALGVPVADPVIGIAITVVILRITWQSWHTVRASLRRLAKTGEQTG